MPDPAAFRAEFPVLARVAHLNAGTEGPIPRRAAEAVRERIDQELTQGRGSRPYMEGVLALAQELRAAYAGLLGSDPSEVALTGSTTDGINTVIGGLELGPDDEILTTDEEHPGLLAPLGRARQRFGVTIRVVPWSEIAGSVSSATQLIACSHVSYVDGKVMDVPALVATGVPVLLDGAQGIGAIPLDMRALGCDYYAASGQKWLCGPEGSGCLFVRADRLDELVIPWPSFGSVADPENALEFTPKEHAARLDHGFPVGVRSVWALASLEVLSAAGWQWVHSRSASLAAGLAEQLAAAGIDVAPRGRSTLVSWHAEDPPAVVQRLAAARVVVRPIPGFGLVRASVGAWSSEDELARLMELVSG